MSDAPACAEMCAGCHSECAACATMACGGCGGCDSAKLGRRARVATANLELLQVFGFNPGQRRGPDGRWIKMGGRGSAGKGGLPKGSKVPDAPTPEIDRPAAPKRDVDTPARPAADTPAGRVARRAYRDGDVVPLADGGTGRVVGGPHQVAGRPGLYVAVRPDAGGKLREVAVEAIRKRQARAEELRAADAGDSTGYGSTEITDKPFNGVTRYDFAPKDGGKAAWVSLGPSVADRWADALTSGGDATLQAGVRNPQRKADRTEYGAITLTTGDDGSVNLHWNTPYSGAPEGSETDVKLTAGQAARLADKIRSNAARDRRVLETDSAARRPDEPGVSERKKRGQKLLAQVNDLKKQVGDDFEMDDEELNAAYESIDSDAPDSPQVQERLRKLLVQYGARAPRDASDDAPAAGPAVNETAPVAPPTVNEITPQVAPAGADRGPAPVGFTPRSDKDWNLLQKRLGKRTARTDPDGELQPGDVVPTSDGKWQEVLRRDPSKFWERNGLEGWEVRDDAKGYVHGESSRDVKRRIEQYAAEKAWRDSGGSKDRLDGVASAPVDVTTGRRPGEPPIGPDGKYAKRVKQYVTYNGEVYDRTSRNPYRYAAVYAHPDNPEGFVGSWHRTRESAAKGTMTGSQRQNGLYIKDVLETQFEPPASRTPAAAPAPAPARSMFQRPDAAERAERRTQARKLVNQLDKLDERGGDHGLSPVEMDRLQQAAESGGPESEAAIERLQQALDGARVRADRPPPPAPPVVPVAPRARPEPRATRAQIAAYTDQIAATARKARDAAFDGDLPAGSLDRYKVRELADRLEELDRARERGDLGREAHITSLIRRILVTNGVAREDELPPVPKV